MVFQRGFRIEILVENTVIVELKSIEQVAAVHAKQVLTYLRLTGLQVGLLLNFGAPTMRGGITRLVNNYSASVR